MERTRRRGEPKTIDYRPRVEIEAPYVQLYDKMRGLPIESTTQTEVYIAGLESRVGALSDAAYRRLLAELPSGSPEREIAESMRKRAAPVSE